MTAPTLKPPSAASSEAKIGHVGFVGAPTKESMPCYEAGGMTGGVVGLWPLAPADDEAEDGSGTSWSRQIDTIDYWATIPRFRPVVDVHLKSLDYPDIRAEFVERLNALVNLCDISGVDVLGWKLHMEMRLGESGKVRMPPSAQWPIDCLGEHLRGNDWDMLAWIAEAMRDARATPLWTPGLLTERVKDQDDWAMLSVLKKMRRTALWPLIDVVNLHPYCFPRRIEGLAPRLDDMFFEAEEFGKPLGCTEWGLTGIDPKQCFIMDNRAYWYVPKGEESTAIPVTYARYSPEEQARAIKMCLPIFAKHRFLNLCWWRYSDTQGPGDPTWDPYCGLVDVNGKPKPSYHAYIGAAREWQS